MPSLAPIQLRTARSQIEQDSHHLPLAAGLDEVAEAFEAAMYDTCSFAERRQGLTGRGYRHCIPVDAQDLEIRSRFEQLPAVSPAADRRIHHEPGWNGRKELDDLSSHHRLVRVAIHRVPRHLRTHVPILDQPPGRLTPFGCLSETTRWKRAE